MPISFSHLLGFSSVHITEKDLLGLVVISAGNGD